MKKEKVYLTQNNSNGYKYSTPAEIVGVSMCTPDGLKPRLCYRLLWSDGKEDFVPMENGDYTIITFDELFKNK